MSEAEEILIEPHITEKATQLAQDNQYAFKVDSDTNKPEIKKAVEQAYDVDVIKVRTMNNPRKKRKKGELKVGSRDLKKLLLE